MTGPDKARALALLDRAAADPTVRPLSLGELEGRMRPTSVRLTDRQLAELERLRVELVAGRPELAALARTGELTPYAVLRLAIDRGLRELAADVERQKP